MKTKTFIFKRIKDRLYWVTGRQLRIILSTEHSIDSSRPISFECMYNGRPLNIIIPENAKVKFE